MTLIDDKRGSISRSRHQLATASGRWRSFAANTAAMDYRRTATRFTSRSACRSRLRARPELRMAAEARSSGWRGNRAALSCAGSRAANFRRGRRRGVLSGLAVSVFSRNRVLRPRHGACSTPGREGFSRAAPPCGVGLIRNPHEAAEARRTRSARAHHSSSLDNLSEGAGKAAE